LPFGETAGRSAFRTVVDQAESPGIGVMITVPNAGFLMELAVFLAILAGNWICPGVLPTRRCNRFSSGNHGDSFLPSPFAEFDPLNLDFFPGSAHERRGGGLYLYGKRMEQGAS
jgi:hypothetical protein